MSELLKPSLTFRPTWWTVPGGRGWEGKRNKGHLQARPVVLQLKAVALMLLGQPVVDVGLRRCGSEAGD